MCPHKVHLKANTKADVHPCNWTTELPLTVQPEALWLFAWITVLTIWIVARNLYCSLSMWPLHQVLLPHVLLHWLHCVGKTLTTWQQNWSLQLCSGIWEYPDTLIVSPDAAVVISFDCRNHRILGLVIPYGHWPMTLTSSLAVRAWHWHCLHIWSERAWKSLKSEFRS